MLLQWALGCLSLNLYGCIGALGRRLLDLSDVLEVFALSPISCRLIVLVVNFSLEFLYAGVVVMYASSLFYRVVESERKRDCSFSIVFGLLWCDDDYYALLCSFHSLYAPYSVGKRDIIQDVSRPRLQE